MDYNYNDVFFLSSTTHVSSDSNQHPNDSGVQDGGAVEKDKEMSALFITNVDNVMQLKKAPKTETISLYETSTHVLLDLPSSCLSNEDENAEKVKKNNQKYIDVSNELSL